MIKNKNRFGLSRNIPEEVKRQVRKRCGFGCVICGSFIFEYEHIKPEFHEAKSHDPDKITLLCPTCHSKVTKGLLSKKEVEEHNKNPFCKSANASETFLENAKNMHEIIFAGTTIKNCPKPIVVKDLPLIKIDKNEEGIFLLSANFFNSKGIKSLEIVENEWIINSNNWDFECKGNQMTIRDEKGLISLKLEINPPDTLIVKKVNMYLYNYHFIGNDKELFINGSKFSGVIIDNCEIGFKLN